MEFICRLSHLTRKGCTMDYFFVTNLTFFIIVIFIFDSRLKGIEKQNIRMDKKIGLLLHKLNIQYPNPSKLSTEVIEEKSKGNISNACSLIMKEHGCSYDEAYYALSLWPAEGSLE
jgi:hypothetical protein